MRKRPSIKSRFSDDAPGLVALLNNCADFERAEAEHWYRIPVQAALEGIEDIRWIAFYLTQAFGPQKWAVRHWAKVKRIDQRRRVDLLPSQSGHPRAQNWYLRIALGPLQTRPEPIYSRRRRRIVFIPSIWQKFAEALEINDLVHGSPLEDRLWVAFKHEAVEAERQWWEVAKKTRYCLDFAVFCADRNIDVECDGDRWHSNPEAALYDNARNNFLEERGWHVLRFNTVQITSSLSTCVQSVATLINHCGGLLLADDSVKPLPRTDANGMQQKWLF
jgi:very-short-patch-repair endonuclease